MTAFTCADFNEEDEANEAMVMTESSARSVHEKVNQSARERTVSRDGCETQRRRLAIGIAPRPTNTPFPVST
jgi:hypothetical protein